MLLLQKCLTTLPILTAVRNLWVSRQYLVATFARQFAHFGRPYNMTATIFVSQFSDWVLAWAQAQASLIILSLGKMSKAPRNKLLSPVSRWILGTDDYKTFSNSPTINDRAVFSGFTWLGRILSPRLSPPFLNGRRRASRWLASKPYAWWQSCTAPAERSKLI